tara:strand:- start:316 stop:597 length:282 start_codon:yes stop_codon:yes gene_type:complete
VKTNYEEYLKSNSINKIEDDKIPGVVDSLYTEKKEHLRGFILNSMKEMLKSEYPGDLPINAILNDVFIDDEFNKTKLVDEIKTYQSLKEKKNV